MPTRTRIFNGNKIRSCVITKNLVDDTFRTINYRKVTRIGSCLKVDQEEEDLFLPRAKWKPERPIPIMCREDNETGHGGLWNCYLDYLIWQTKFIEHLNSVPIHDGCTDAPWAAVEQKIILTWRHAIYATEDIQHLATVWNTFNKTVW